MPNASLGLNTSRLQSSGVSRSSSDESRHHAGPQPAAKSRRVPAGTGHRGALASAINKASNQNKIKKANNDQFFETLNIFFSLKSVFLWGSVSVKSCALPAASGLLPQSWPWGKGEAGSVREGDGWALPSVHHRHVWISTTRWQGLHLTEQHQWNLQLHLSTTSTSSV